MTLLTSAIGFGPGIMPIAYSPAQVAMSSLARPSYRGVAVIWDMFCDDAHGK